MYIIHLNRLLKPKKSMTNLFSISRNLFTIFIWILSIKPIYLYINHK